jgi:hypothetical protein
MSKIEVAMWAQQVVASMAHVMNARGVPGQPKIDWVRSVPNKDLKDGYERPMVYFRGPRSVAVDVDRLELYARSSKAVGLFAEVMASYALYREYEMKIALSRVATKPGRAEQPTLHPHGGGRWHYWSNKFVSADLP